MTKVEYNNDIEKRRNNLIEYYDKKIGEIENMRLENFCLHFLNKEKTIALITQNDPNQDRCGSQEQTDE